MNAVRSLSQLLSDFSLNLQERHQQNAPVSIAHILEAFHERGFGVVLFVFALPMALPLPVPPGINVLLALPLILLTAQQMLGRHAIWLPDKIKQKTISSVSLIKMLGRAVPWIQKIEILVRPRLGFLTQGIFSYAIGFCGLIMALTICIPLPLTNTVPSLGIACMAIGVVMRDGLAVLAGALTGLLWVCLLVFLGEAGIRLLIGAIL